MAENKNHPLQRVNKTTQNNWLTKLENVTGKPITKAEPFLSSVFFLLDCSSSMDADNKFIQARKGGIEYAIDAKKKGYKIGLISFDSNANKILSPQENIELFQIELNRLIPSGSTNLTDAIKIAKENLLTLQGEKIIFIVTDGFPDNSNSAIEEAKSASKLGIEIMTLGTDDADLDFLNKLSTKKEFSIKVDKRDFAIGIKSMSKLLPAKE